MARCYPPPPRVVATFEAKQGGHVKENWVRDTGVMCILRASAVLVTVCPMWFAP